MALSLLEVKSFAVKSILILAKEIYG